MPVNSSSPGLQSDGHDHDHDACAIFDTAVPGVVADRIDLATLKKSGAAAAAMSGAGFASATMNATLYPLSSIPVLNSFASAPVSIYLDFNGHTSGTTVTPVYDADGDETTFSEQELQFITDLWRVTAEDFSPFNINVTTVEPSVLAPGMPAAAANGKALRVAIGGTNPPYAGWAMYNSFTNSQENVVWVYAQGRTDPVPYGTTASHEAAHSFGLRHTGGEIEGQADGWWDIMRSGIVSNVRSIWTTGVNDQDALQDDMAVITSSLNGITYRADDHIGNVAGATPLTGSGANFAGSGRIGSTSDVDVFSIPATGESLRISVAGDSPSQNLDAVLELLDVSGNVVVRSDAADSVNASLVADSTNPVYFAVRSNGQYGRIGQYTVTVEASAPGATVAGPKAPLTTSETGRSTSFTVTLNARPAADVTFNIGSSDTSEGIVSTASVAFTPANWFIPQTVAITGVADGVSDGAAGYTVALAPAESSDPSYSGLDPADLNLVNLDDAPGHVYWIRSSLTADLAVIERSNLAGEAVQTVLDIPEALGPAPTGNYNPSRLTIDAVGGKMYWTDTSNKTVSRANLDGSGAQVVLTLANSPNDVAIDLIAGKIYWTDSVLDKIQRANLDGSAVQDVIASGLTNPIGLELDLISGKLYWSDSTTYEISRANLDGSNIELVRAGDGLNQPQSITLDVQSGKIYYGLRQNFQTQQLYRANLDGSAEEMLVDLNAIDPSIPNPVVQSIGIDHAGGRMFWSDSISNRLFSADLDGGNIAVVLDSTTYLRGLAILPALPGFTVTPVSGLSTTEAGGMASFTVALTARPTADVTIPVATSDATEGTASVSSLTFTPTNWSTPQTVTVTGVDDSVYDQDVAYNIVLGAAVSVDPKYNGLNPADVSVLNRDNDPPPTKFYVVNDATQNATYEYNPAGGLVESYNLNSGNTAPRGAASTVAGDKVWVVDANRRVYVYNAGGAILGSWTAGSLANNATPEGITTNGTDIWIVDSRSDRVYRYAGAASRLSGSQNAGSNFALNSGNTSPKDIVTSGSSFWVVNDATTDKVFKYSMAGALQGSWTIDSANRAPTGITVDPANVSHIWIVDSGTDRVYQYTGAATRTSGSQSAASSFALAAGNTNPQGIADPPVPATVAQPETAFHGDVNHVASSRTVTERRSAIRTARSAAFAAENGFLLSANRSDTTDWNIKSKRHHEDADRRVAAAASVDAALEQLDYSAWVKLVTDF